MQKNTTFDKISRLVALVSVIIIFITILIAISVFQQDRRSETQKLNEQGRKLVAALDDHLNIQKVTLKILEAEAQSILAGDKLPVKLTTDDLVPWNDPPGFYLRPPAGKTENQVGSLTGLGGIPEPGTPPAREIDMALSLSPIFEQVIQNDASLPWVYYTSASRFFYIYPFISPSEFFFSDALFEKEFYRIGIPAQNPDREMTWSPLYEDAAGKGLMVTLSKPVYDGDRFLGVLSIDIGLADLKWLLEDSGLAAATPYLIGSDGKMIAGQGNQDFSLDVSAVQPETMTDAGGLTFLAFPLHETNWYIVLDIDKGRLILEAINASAYMGIILLFEILSLIIVLVIAQNMHAARFMAVHDSLTGMLNRRGYDEYAASAVGKGERAEDSVGVAIIDIDFFKRYNDHYGHQAGDEALRQVAAALNNCLRRSGDKLFRVGGEEFTVVLDLNNPNELQTILNRLTAAIVHLNLPHTESPFGRLTISIGGVMTRMDKPNQLEDAYKRADHALYKAKEAGRNCWVID